MSVIVTSKLDSASMNIHKQLTKYLGFRKRPDGLQFDGSSVYMSGDILLVTSERELVNSEHIDQSFKTDLLIFASRHRSEAGKPALLVHCTGNWTGQADLGGEPCELAIAPASAMREALRELAKQKDELALDNYEVTMECTHHGPTSMSTPLLFVELGSDEKHWADELAARAVANTVYKVAKGVERAKTALGIGGPHYAPNFTKIILSSNNIAAGHIIPNYVLHDMRKDMVQKAIARTLEKVELILLDWKGLRGEHRELARDIADELGVETMKTHDIMKNS